MAFTYDQQRAIDFYGNDLIISAAAGSGKTTTLIKKITESIKKGADVSKMLIVTFTKAAANELRSRLSHALSEIMKSGDKSEHISSQLLKVGSADICTIDSFCIRLIRPNFDRIGIDADFRIGEESEISVIRAETMEDVIDSFYEKEERDEDFYIVCDCFGSMARDEELPTRLLELYSKLISTRESLKLLVSSSYDGGEFTDTPYGKIALEAVKRFVDHFRSAYKVIMDEAMSDAKTEGSYLPALASDLFTVERLGALVNAGSYGDIRDALFSYIPMKMKAVRGECSADTELIKGVRDSFKDGVASLKNKLFLTPPHMIPSVFAQNNAVCHAIYRVLSEFEREFAKRKKAYGVCDFNDVERYALDLLYGEDGSISDVAEEWAKKYDLIFIDEYQDTNSVQDAIFSAISRKNRFMVGDIKQSIYRFRSAEPEIFASYREGFTPIDSYTEESAGASIFMSENFRSDRGVIDFANLVSDFMLKNSRGIPYSHKDRLICSKNGGDTGAYTPAEIYLIDKDEEEGELNSEAELVADKIKDILENDRLASGERVQPCQIAILLRSKDATEDYISALKCRGVMSEYISEERFFERSEILLVLCLLNVIDSPTRDAYLAGALMSGVFGFSLEELVRVRKRTKELTSLYASCRAYDSDDDTGRRLQLFFKTVEEYRERSRRMRSHEIIAALYAELGIVNGAEPAERRSLQRLYDMARRYEGASYKGLSAFLRYVDKISSDKVKEELASAEKDNCVKVMTVHASKGLEFEYCFLCETAKRFNAVDTRAPLMFERRLGVSGFVSRQGGLAKYDTVLRACAANAISVSSTEEEMRILYVALTRARHKMTVTAKVKAPEALLQKKRGEAAIASEYSVLGETSQIMWILSACAEPSSVFDIKIVKNGEEKSRVSVDNGKRICYNKDEAERLRIALMERLSFEYFKEHLNKIPSKLSVSRLSPTVLDGSENEEVDQNISIDTVPSFLLGEDRATGAEAGTATHLFMQFCDFDALYERGAEAELERLLKEGYISERAYRLVNKRHIENFRHSALLGEMRRAARILREFRFNVLFDAAELSADPALKGERVLVQGVIDCVYEDEDGNIILVDYKTDKVTKENYVGLLTDRHKNQLRYYKKACEMMLERPVSRVMLYSVPMADTVEITHFEEV